MEAGLTARRYSPWGSLRSTARVSLGRRFERIGCAYVRRAGLRLRARNLRILSGEIDILAEGTAGWVIVEVRGRSGGGWRPVRALSGAKRRRLKALAVAVSRGVRAPVRVVLLEIVGKPGLAASWLPWVAARWPKAFGLEIRDYEI